MLNVVVVTGVCGSGKSFYCNNKPSLIYDNIYNYNMLSINKRLCKEFFDKYDNGNLVYLDGYNTELLDFINNNYKVTFKVVIVYTNTDDLYDIIHKTHPRKFGSNNYDEFINIYNKTLNCIVNNIHSNTLLSSNITYLYRNKEKYTEYNKPDHLMQLINEPIPNRLFNFIKDTSGHASYQTIEYKGTNIINGSERDFITMNNILKCTNLNNKRIMDTGCFNGYFSFQCLKNGAKQVIGVDHNEAAIDICNKIALYNNYHSWVMKNKINNCCPLGLHFYLKKIGVDNIFTNDIINNNNKLDIIFALNYLHHLKNELGHDSFMSVIDSFFKNSSEIIFEINEPEMNDIESIAKKNNYLLKHNIESHRKTSFGNRRVLHYITQ